MALAEDTILGNRYRIDGLLADKGQSAVYRAFDLNTSAPVAIKEYHLTDSDHTARFKQKAIILERLRYPDLPQVLNHFSLGQKTYLVTDFVEGQNLWDIIQQSSQPLAEQTALAHIIQVCRAVQYLHQQTPPLVHGDIKPQNIRLTPAGQAMLVDYGMFKQVAGVPHPQPAGAGFLSPEQAGGDRVTPASDIFSLGATLYTILTGLEPPPGPQAAKPELPDRLNSTLSHQVSEAIANAMQPDPVERPRSIAAWQETLEAIAEGLARNAADPTSPAGTVTMPPSESQVKTQARATIRPKPASANYWLVDATGLGYPVGSEPLLIGRHPQADIIIDDASMSRHHAEVRLESRRCLVQDKASANGTFLNGHRLGTEWYPLNPGDLLTLGSVRFHLTTTRPVKVISSKPKPTPVLNVVAIPPPGQTDELPEPPPQPRQRRVLNALISVLLLALVGVIAFYWPLVSIDLPLLSDLSSNPEVPVSQTQSDQAGDDQAAALVLAEAENSRQAEEGTATVEAGLVAAMTATAESIVTIAILTGTVTAPDNTPTRLPATGTPTASPTPSPATITPTRTPIRVVPAAAGPTAIPINSNESIVRIGVTEVIDIDMNPQNPDEVYALVKRDGLYKSSSGGDGPWLKLPVDASGVVAFVIDPTNPARFYAPTWNAVLKSTDGGNTWEAKTNGLISNRAVDVLVVDPKRPNRLYAGIGENLVVSTDGGETWTSLGYGEGLGVGRLHQIVVDPFNSDIVYVAGLASAVYKSTDAGHTFIPMPYNVGQGAYGLAAHPAQKDVYLAGINSATGAIIKTENAWDFELVSTGLIYGGADSAYSALAYAPGNPMIVYAGTGYEDNRYAKGLFKSVDGGENWANISTGLSLNRDFGLPFYIKSIAVHPTNPNVVFVATGGGLSKSVDGGATWSLR
jgi:serine/threonine protein kinase/photosystem II stability/assembly factor-like uncharacterized protein